MSDTRVYIRSNALPDLHSRVYRMLEEVGQLNRRFFTDEARERHIKDLIEIDYDSSNGDSLCNMLRTGFKGYANYTDMELVNEQMIHHCNDMYEDDEFEHHIFHDIEVGLNACAKDLLSEAFEKHVIKE